MSGWLWPDSTITAVIDGDTINARLTRDIGFGGTTTFVVRLRLNRINAHAKNTPAGRMAREFLEPLIGHPMLIETRKPYKYGGPGTSPGAWMAEVTTSEGINLSDWLVLLDLAIPWDGTGVRPEPAT